MTHFAYVAFSGEISHLRSRTGNRSPRSASTTVATEELILRHTRYPPVSQ